jgi:DNA-directed RNA polymerase subunit beta'
LFELNFSEIKKLDKQNRFFLYQLNKSIVKLKKQAEILLYDKNTKNALKELCKKRDLLIRRTKLIRKLYRKDSDPSSMILTLLPVLPPDLRPIVKMGDQIAASDLNILYKRVIYRNERLKKFLKDPATSYSSEMKYAQRLLQEAVDNLIQNGKSSSTGGAAEKDSRGRILKSLSDLLKGKQGRFRQFLLGKRVDYSGRSVIVVGPKLKLSECGIPFEMAKVLYLPFLMKVILKKHYARTNEGAKKLIQNNPALIQELLNEIMQASPVLLNRAPTLHRLGIQAFVPKLVEGRAILLHPLVCSAFNADFDGDQMAVHVPITVEARAEAWKLMLSRNNLLSPATGDPLAIPSQDMVLGCYYLTTYSNKGSFHNLKGSGLYFNNFNEVVNAYNNSELLAFKTVLNLHSLIWVKWVDLIENGSDQTEPLEIRVSPLGNWQEISTHYHRLFDSKNIMINQYVTTTPGRILFNMLLQKIT